MKVLCAIDGSAGSDAAVQLLGQLLSDERDDIVFYYSPPRISVRGPTAVSSDVVEQAAVALVEKVVDRARSLLPQPLIAKTSVVTDHQKPRHGINEAAKVHRPDLIAVGARGTSRFGLPRLGSVSRSVVNSADVPVLVARARERPSGAPLQLIACCDQTELCETSGHFLSQLSFPENAQGRVVHVAESLFVHGLPEWLVEEARASESDPIARAYVEEHDAELESLREKVEIHCKYLPDPFHESQPVVLEGHPGEQIVKFAEAERIDLVVVGAHITHPLARMLAGSTSIHVLAHAHCSVLIVPYQHTP
jgi:nucleotide-binding universal stress UspA family protein